MSSLLPVRIVSPEDVDGATLAQQIEASGPISVHEFMRFANNAYYGRKDPLGVEGDFITAPEISQMFGEMVGIWLTDIWMRQGKPQHCHYVELGPGRGSLAADALRTMHRFGFEPAVHFVENSPALRAKLLHMVPTCTHHDDIGGVPSDGPMFVIANEFFDALPVRQLIATHAGWRERVVVRDRGARFAALPGAVSVDHMVPAPFRNAAVGSIFELAPDAANVMRDLSNRLLVQGGVMLTVDYGYTQPAIGSTLQAVKNHAYADPFADVGQCDLTTHVNFHELANIARNAGLAVAGPNDQGRWLSSLGIARRAEALLYNHPDRADEISAALNRLIQPDAMGTLFKVMASYAPEWPAPEGFAI